MTQPESEEIDWDDYRETEYDRVWVHTSAQPRLVDNITKEAAAVADAFAPEVVAAVVVDAGPYRTHDVAFGWKDPEADVLYLDYYSVRPGLDYTTEIISDIEASLDQ